MTNIASTIWNAGSGSAAAWSNATGAAGGSVGGNTGLFQQLAENVQAVLLQGLGGTGTTGASAIGGTTTTDPAQQLASSLQSIFAQLQASASGNDPSTQTASINQGNPTAGQPQPHHHHHHHHMGGGSSDGATTGGGHGGGACHSWRTGGVAGALGRHHAGVAGLWQRGQRQRDASAECIVFSA